MPQVPVPLSPGAKPRPSREVLMRVVQPLADRCVAALARTRVAPHEVVLFHTGLGLAAAWLLAGAPAPAGAPGGWLAAALLLQVKTVLDNADGGLARATGRVTEMGRYLDTLMDLAVNVALFWALAQHGPAWLAWTALAALTLVLSADFNAMRRYLEERGQYEEEGAPPGAPAPVMALLRGAYAALLAPQDRLLRWLDEELFAAASGTAWQGAAPASRRRWADRSSVAPLVNLGLSTQMLALGLCAALGSPYAYVVLVLLQIPYLVVLQAWRALRYRQGSGP